MSLKSRIYEAASEDAGLVAILGSSPFRFWDQVLQQGQGFPAVVMETIGNPRDYVATGQLPTGWATMQFRVYGSGNDSENANTVVQALDLFFRSLNLLGAPVERTAFPNNIIGDRDMGIADTKPPTFMRVLTVRMLVNADLD